MATHDVKAAVRGTRILYLEDGMILDEMSLPPFESPTEKGREETVREWLSSMPW